MSWRFSDLKMAPQIRSMDSDTPGRKNRTSARTSEFKLCDRRNFVEIHFFFPSFTITSIGFESWTLPVGVTQDKALPITLSTGVIGMGERKEFHHHNRCMVTLRHSADSACAPKIRTRTRFTGTRHGDWRLISRRGFTDFLQNFSF